jgi:hypothetical protein
MKLCFITKICIFAVFVFITIANAADTPKPPPSRLERILRSIPVAVREEASEVPVPSPNEDPSAVAAEEAADIPEEAKEKPEVEPTPSDEKPLPPHPLVIDDPRDPEMSFVLTKNPRVVPGVNLAAALRIAYTEPDKLTSRERALKVMILEFDKNSPRFHRYERLFAMHLPKDTISVKKTPAEKKAEKMSEAAAAEAGAGDGDGVGGTTGATPVVVPGPGPKAVMPGTGTY